MSHQIKPKPESPWPDQPTVSAMRDRGWLCPADRFSKWRQLGANLGYHRNISRQKGWYTIITDGVHLIVMHRKTKEWQEVHITNWIGPISPHYVDIDTWDWENNCPIMSFWSKRPAADRPKSGEKFASGSESKLSAKQLAKEVDELIG